MKELYCSHLRHGVSRVQCSALPDLYDFVSNEKRSSVVHT